MASDVEKNCSYRYKAFSHQVAQQTYRISKYGTITVEGTARNGKGASTKSLYRNSMRMK